MAVRNRLAALHAQKEAREGRRIPLTEASAAVGVSRQTFTSWYNNDLNAFYADTIEALCLYYECGIEQLLVIVPEDNYTLEETPEEMMALATA